MGVGKQEAIERHLWDDLDSALCEAGFDRQSSGLPRRRQLCPWRYRRQSADVLAEYLGYASQAAVIPTVNLYRPEAKASGFFIIFEKDCFWHSDCSILRRGL